MTKNGKHAADVEPAPAPFVVCVFDEDTSAANDFEFRDRAAALKFAHEENKHPTKVLVLERRLSKGRWHEFSVDLEPRDET